MFDVLLSRHQDGGLILSDGPPSLTQDEYVVANGNRYIVPESDIGPFLRRLVEHGLSFAFDGETATPAGSESAVTKRCASCGSEYARVEFNHVTGLCPVCDGRS